MRDVHWRYTIQCIKSDGRASASSGLRRCPGESVSLSLMNKIIVSNTIHDIIFLFDKHIEDVGEFATRDR